MNALDDVARFRADDDARLVAASFACPVCLGLDAAARLVLESDDDSEVECSCDTCGADWAVAVNPAQVMRLVLHPPDARDAPLRMLTPRTAHAPWSRRDEA